MVLAVQERLRCHCRDKAQCLRQSRSQRRARHRQQYMSSACLWLVASVVLRHLEVTGDNIVPTTVGGFVHVVANCGGSRINMLVFADLHRRIVFYDCAPVQNDPLRLSNASRD